MKTFILFVMLTQPDGMLDFSFSYVGKCPTVEQAKEAVDDIMAEGAKDAAVICIPSQGVPEGTDI